MFEKSCWGIDIGSSAVTGVKLRRAKHGVEVLKADVVPLEGEASPETSFGRDRRIWIALDSLARRNEIGGGPLVISVPGRATFVRPFDVLKVSGKPLNDLVRFEVQQHIPFGLDAVVWDHELFGQAADGSHQSGTMFAIKKEVLNNYLMSLSTARLQADDVMSAPLALYNYARYDLDLPEPALLIDVGATCTDLAWIGGGRYVLSSIAAGGDLITRAVEEGLGISQLQAERAKRRVREMRGAREVLEIMLPALRRLVGLVGNTVHRMRAEAAGGSLKQVVLFGGASGTVGLDRLLAQTLECSVQVPQTYHRVRFNNQADRASIERSLPRLGVATGLALRGLGEANTRISLISPGATRKKIASRTRPALAAALAVAALIMVWVVAFGSWKLGRMTRARAELQENLSPVEENIRTWELLRQPVEEQGRIEQYSGLGRRRLACLGVLNKVIGVLPPANGRRGRDLEKAWLLELAIEPEGPTANVYSWWAVRARANAEDLDFAERRVLNQLAQINGFSAVVMRSGKKGEEGYRYSDVLKSSAPPAPQGRYLILPVTFQADLGKLSE